MPYPRVQGSEENPINEHRIKAKPQSPQIFTRPAAVQNPCTAALPARAIATLLSTGSMRGRIGRAPPRSSSRIASGFSTLSTPNATLLPRPSGAWAHSRKCINNLQRLL